MARDFTNIGRVNGSQHNPVIIRRDDFSASSYADWASVTNALLTNPSNTLGIAVTTEAVLAVAKPRTLAARSVDTGKLSVETETVVSASAPTSGELWQGPGFHNAVNGDSIFVSVTRISSELIAFELKSINNGGTAVSDISWPELMSAETTFRLRLDVVKNRKDATTATAVFYVNGKEQGRHEYLISTYSLTEVHAAVFRRVTNAADVGIVAKFDEFRYYTGGADLEDSEFMDIYATDFDSSAEALAFTSGGTAPLTVTNGKLKIPTTGAPGQLGIALLKKLVDIRTTGAVSLRAHVKGFVTIEDSGTATSGGATTLNDTGKVWVVNAWAGFFVCITAGTGAGQCRAIISNTATQLVVAAWTTQPDNTSVYSIQAGLGVDLGLYDLAGNYTALGYTQSIDGLANQRAAGTLYGQFASGKYNHQAGFDYDYTDFVLSVEFVYDEGLNVIHWRVYVNDVMTTVGSIGVAAVAPNGLGGTYLFYPVVLAQCIGTYVADHVYAEVERFSVLRIDGTEVLGQVKYVADEGVLTGAGQIGDDVLGDGVEGEIVYTRDSDKTWRYNGTLWKVWGDNSGANVVAANNLTLGHDGNFFVITGNTTINAITTLHWQSGAVVRLLFTGTPTVKHNTAGGGGTAVLKLAGSEDFAAGADSVLQLVYDGTSWQEMSRKKAV